MSDEEMDVAQFQNLGEYHQRIFHEDTDAYEKGSAGLVPDNREHMKALRAFDQMFRAMYSEQLEELKGDADEILLTDIHITSDDVPEIKYVRVYDDE